jgi:tetratricopeptide (TPR) repeat protein
MFRLSTAAPLPRRVVFLCRNEETVRTDAKSLRALGLRTISYITDAAALLRFLESDAKGRERAEAMPPNAFRRLLQAAEAILCEENLGDLPASVLLYALSRHPDFAAKPALLLAAGSGMAEAWRAAKLPALHRPYTQARLEEALRAILSPGAPALSPSALEKAETKGLVIRLRPRSPKPPSAPLTTTDWHRRGLALLRAGDYAEAREVFRIVLARQEEHLEACLALARACQGEQDRAGALGALLRAAAICLRKGDALRAGRIVARLPQGMRDNIFVHDAMARMEEGDDKAAALSFLDADRERPDTPLHRIIARACLMTSAPEEHMRRLCEAFESLGRSHAAATLRRRLLEYPEFSAYAGPPSWLDKHPRLKEVVGVASCAAVAWKEA